MDFQNVGQTFFCDLYKGVFCMVCVVFHYFSFNVSII